MTDISYSLYIITYKKIPSPIGKGEQMGRREIKRRGRG